MKTAIIIPTYNQEKYTIKCFQSIAKSAPQAVIYWVDNGSNEESRQKVKEVVKKESISCREIFLERNLGFVKGVNAGLKAALTDDNDYYVIQNNDTEVYTHWLKPMIKAAETESKVGMVGPISNNSAWQIPEHLGKFVSELTDIPQYIGKPEDYAEKVWKLYGEKIFILDNARMLSFFSVLIKKEVIKKVGFLSEEYGVGYGDDDDYSMRVKKAGFKLALTPGAFVFHDHKTTFKSIYSDEEIKEMQDKNLEIFRNNHGLYGRKKYYLNKIRKAFRWIK